jgi:hypothetical protein
VYLLIINDSKYGFALLIAPCINTYTVIGTVVMIPGFSGGFSVIKNPADFEFSLYCDKRGILEYP